LPSDWAEALAPWLTSEKGLALARFVEAIYASGKPILPAREDLFCAFRLTPLAETRVVILGQDPYPTPGYGHGLAFSVRPPHPIAPSLRNLLKELATDLGGSILKDTDLSPWARQGVLLLNTILTVEAHRSLAHAKAGWEDFTDAVLSLVNQRGASVVFVLWGNKAQAKRALIDETKHLVIASAHPSPLSARHGFFGSKPFSKVNAWLEAHGESPITW
jgi:uracil-DNA glycosylase